MNKNYKMEEKNIIKYPFVFIDESGVGIKQESFFAVGFLKIISPERLTQALLNNHFGSSSSAKSKRQEFIKNYLADPKNLTQQEIHNIISKVNHKEYHFSEINKYNLQSYKNFLNTCKDFEFDFSCIIYKIKNNSSEFMEKWNYWDFYLENIEWFSRFNILNSERCTLIADHTNQSKNKTTISERFNMQYKINNCLTTESIGQPLLQLCDILLGCIVFQFKELHNLNNSGCRVNTKRELIDDFRKNLTFSNQNEKYILTSSNSTEKQNFNIWCKIPKKDSPFEVATLQVKQASQIKT